MTARNVLVHSAFDTEAAALLVQTASCFASHITLRVNDKTANAKSIMGIISLGVAAEQTIILTADGSDEQAALSALSGFFRSRTSG